MSQNDAQVLVRSYEVRGGRAHQQDVRSTRTLFSSCARRHRGRECISGDYLARASAGCSARRGVILRDPMSR
jgi:hypothetical protein